MEKAWEWSSMEPGEWKQLTDIFYAVFSKSAVQMLGLVNRQYKELRLQLLSKEKSCSAYLQQGPKSLRVGIKGDCLSNTDISTLSQMANRIDQSIAL